MKNPFRRKTLSLTYDATEWEPVIKASICTGEKTAGFRHRTSHQFREDMLIRGEEDLLLFKAKYGIDGDMETIY